MSVRIVTMKLMMKLRFARTAEKKLFRGEETEKKEIENKGGCG